MPPERTLHYLKHGLAASPVVLETLLTGVTAAELDFRPDPDRFTLREVVAHLADWEPIWLQRLTAIATEDNPFLPGYDEGQFALDHDYSHSDAAEQLTAFRQARDRTVAFLSELAPEAWTGPSGRHTEWGSITIYDLATLMCGHDGYHLRQVVEWRDGWKSRAGGHGE